MKKLSLLTPSIATLLCVGTLSAVACSSGSSDPGDSMGGDAPSTGGTSTSTGGTGTGGGTGSTGGTPSNGGAPGGETLSFAFGADLQGMYVDYEVIGDSGGMGGAASFLSELSFESADGDPDDGSAKLSAPFDYTGDGTYDDLEKVHSAIVLESPIDFSDGTGSVRVKLVSGGSTDEACPVVSKMFVKNADFEWANGAEANLEEGKWVTLTISGSAPSYPATGFDASSVGMVGVEVTPNAATGCVSTAVVVLFDTFTLNY